MDDFCEKSGNTRVILTTKITKAFTVAREHGCSASKTIYLIVNIIMRALLFGKTGSFRLSICLGLIGLLGREFTVRIRTFNSHTHSEFF